MLANLKLAKPSLVNSRLANSRPTNLRLSNPRPTNQKYPPIGDLPIKNFTNLKLAYPRLADLRLADPRLLFSGLLKGKQSLDSAAGMDKIPTQLLKLGAKIIAVPLNWIIFTSIRSGKFPTFWKRPK